MQTALAPILGPWANFYVIIGSSAAALTGLMFVVVTLIAGGRQPGTGDGFPAFGTPTVVHFCLALLIAATLSAPWQMLWQVSVLLGLIGLGGMLYLVVVLRRVRRQTSYQPVLEDWVAHIIGPLMAYVALLIGALLLSLNPLMALFIPGAVTILLLFIGIHNSWDTVTFVVSMQLEARNRSQDKER